MKIDEFWENIHKENNILYLSGHSGITVLRGLFLVDFVDQLVPQESRILEIGVGLGICTKDLHDLGFKVDCVEISKEAVDRVYHLVDTSYTPDGLYCMDSEAYDLAISYCVTQHINDESLQEQLKEVIRALKKTGIFAMQYSWPFEGYPKLQRFEEMASGSCNRPIEKMYQMVEDAGGKIVDSRIFSVSPQYKAGWGILHIMRK